MSEPNSYIPIFSWCRADLDSYNLMHRCFMTGEYCSKQDSIQKERRELHEKDCINAFIVMSFSNVSDVVYKWRIKSFIESIKRDLFFSKDKSSLYCISKLTYPGNEDSDSYESASNRAAKAELDFTILTAAYNKACANSDGWPSIDDLVKEPPIPLAAALDLAKELIAKDRIAENENEINAEEDELETYGLLVKLLMQLYSPTKVDDPLVPVKEINVIRADSDPSTNFVICNRVCQQLQIADLVVVDVSVANANVFYELGMAVAMGKMILPICYSDTYYKMSAPFDSTKYEKQLYGFKAGHDENEKEYAPCIQLKHHIGCFEWRKELFEHFGIRYRHPENDDCKTYTNNIINARKGSHFVVNNQDSTQYACYEAVTYYDFGFDDAKYSKFPYDEKIPIDDYSGLLQVKRFSGLDASNRTEMNIGECIYKKLQISYNFSTSYENTLVVYTMDSFLNGSQAATCIVNYYNAIVRLFKTSNCYCGERVGVLLQSRAIYDDPKDGKQNPMYDVGRIIQIGTNQATYNAHLDIVKPNDFLNDDLLKNAKVILDANNDLSYLKQVEFLRDNLVLNTKEFIRNRGIPIYPMNPFYVQRITARMQNDVFENIDMLSSVYSSVQEKAEKASYFFCLYHVMLRTLRYTNEIVVDIGTNSIQSLFWLGTAHGSDTPAITVRHEVTERQRRLSGESAKNERFIFDVAGLWAALYRDDVDAGDFYSQLARAQSSIEQYSRLTLKNRSKFSEDVLDMFWMPVATSGESALTRVTSNPNYTQQLEGAGKETNRTAIRTNETQHYAVFHRMGEKHKEKECEEADLLESYYRNRVWRTMLRRNKLNIYLRQEKTHQTKEPRPAILKWDIDAVGMLSHYLSRKKTIGEYRIKVLEHGGSDHRAKIDNFICIGSEAGPIIDDYRVAEHLLSYGVFERKTAAEFRKCTKDAEEEMSGRVILKYYHDHKNSVLVTQIPSEKCYKCLLSSKTENDSFIDDSYILQQLPNKNATDICRIKGLWKKGNTPQSESYWYHYHIELARLLLWKDEATSNNSDWDTAPDDLFRIVLSGASGPATNAITSLFVDSQSKNFDDKEFSVEFDDYTVCKHPLNDLQSSAREQFWEKYSAKLRDELVGILFNNGAFDGSSYDELKKKIDGGTEPQTSVHNFLYINQVVEAAKLYLSTVLYRYFLPFLSFEDIERICNGMTMFVYSMQTANCSPFALDFRKYKHDPTGNAINNDDVKRCTEKVVEALRKTLNSFVGIEAFYCVIVKTDEKDIDEYCKKLDENTCSDYQGEDKRRIVCIANCPDVLTDTNAKKHKIKCLFKLT